MEVEWLNLQDIYIPQYFVFQQASTFSPLMDIESPESPPIIDVSKYIEELKAILQVRRPIISACLFIAYGTSCTSRVLGPLVQIII